MITTPAGMGIASRGKWTLEQVLGSGGMAVVYRAAHRNGAKVAIKVLHPELAEDEELRSRFLREGYIANRVDHAGAVKVLDDDFDEASGLAFIVPARANGSHGRRAAHRCRDATGTLALGCGARRDGLIQEHADWLRSVYGDSSGSREVLERLEALIRIAKLKSSDKPPT